MKAGRAGSTPDDAATSRSGPIQPLREFLGRVGEAVANLNTTVVGLDAVENGHEKPLSLTISWNPQDRMAAARKSRRFVVEAVLVLVAEALHQFIWATAQLPRFDEVRSGWNNNNTSAADRLDDVGHEVLGPDSYLVAGAVLLVHWRNRVVHPRSSATPSPRHKRTLKGAAAEIERNFAGLSVMRLLEDFDAQQPTLKDVSTLIAFTIKMARQIDQQVRELSAGDLQRLLEHYGLNGRIARIEAETTPTKKVASVLRMLQAEAPGLVDAYALWRGSPQGQASQT